MKNHRPALIIARPGRLRDAWRALLMATSHFQKVYQAEDEPAALGMVRMYGPKLVLLDGDLEPGEPWALLQTIRLQDPGCRSIALVCNAQQQELAQAAGADVILLRGFAADRLYQEIEHLLGNPGRDGLTNRAEQGRL